MAYESVAFPTRTSELEYRSSCPACAGEHVPEDDVGALHYERCTRCGLIFMDPMPTQRWYDAQYAAAYWRGQARSADPVDEIRRRLRKEHLRATAYLRAVRGLAQMPADGTVLEVGCGSGGAVATLAAGLGWVAAGIEPDIASRDIATRIGVRIETADLDELAEGGTRFEVILLSHVLEHVVDPDGFLRSVVGVLAEGGHLVIEVPNGMTNRSLHLFHPYLFTTRSLTTLLARHGLAATVQAHGGASSHMRRHFLLATATRASEPSVRGIRWGHRVGRSWGAAWKRNRILRRLDGLLVSRAAKADDRLLEHWERALTARGD